MAKVLKLTRCQEIEIPIEEIENFWGDYNSELDDDEKMSFEDYVKFLADDYISDFDSVLYDTYSLKDKGWKVPIDKIDYKIVEEGE